MTLQTNDTYFHIPGIPVNRAIRLGRDRLPCKNKLLANAVQISELSDGLAKDCVKLFFNGWQVSRFHADILLPTWNLTVFQVDVATTPPVECEDPAMVVMSEVACGGPTRQQRQCDRQPQYNTSPNRKRKTCVFQCFNHGLNDIVAVTLQFNKKHWIDGENLRICEIEAYTFW